MMVFTLTAATACGASAPPPVARPARIEVEPPPAEPERAPMTVAGLSGSLGMGEARGALEPRMADFANCFTRRYRRRLRQISGEARLVIRVGVEGDVESAFPEDSTIGNRAVERCLVEVAMDTRFPRPHGGAATVVWPIAIDPPARVRNAELWEPQRVARLVARRGPDILEQCPQAHEANIQVTVYVRGRRVVSVGAASPDGAEPEAFDCVAQQVRRWRMPRARRLSKVTFQLGSAA